MFFLTPIFFLSQDRVSFDQWFLVKPLQDYVNVVTMEVFMKNIASRVWPPGKRIGLFSISGCFSSFMQEWENHG